MNFTSNNASMCTVPEGLTSFNNYGTLIASIASLYGSSVMCSTYFLYSKGNGVSRFVLFLALGDLGWALTEIVAFIMLIGDRPSYTFPICKALRLLFQFFSGSTVFWTLCISIYLYITISKTNKVREMTVNSSPHSPLLTMQSLEPTSWRPPQWMVIVFYVVAWGIPAAQCFIMWFFDLLVQDVSQGVCFPSRREYDLIWFIPLVTAMVLSTIVYVMLIYKAFKAVSWSVWSQYPFRVSLYALVFLFCWSLNVIIFMMRCQINVRAQFAIPLSNILLNSQGLWDCIVYGITNKQFRRNYSGRLLSSFLFFAVSPVALPITFVLFVVRRLNAPTPMKPVNPAVSSYGTPKSFRSLQL